ncbi:MAG: polysaccharide biosynthesis/export family protein [Deltaproteobacteria bacterium]|nr:polysaccharide biosynthesis/export family protein [Deltaproteobacteria bacterium]
MSFPAVAERPRPTRFALAPVLLAAACTTTPSPATPPPHARSSTTADARSVVITAPPLRVLERITLAPGDLLRIRVHRQPSLDLDARIPEGGSVSYPLIGKVQAVGITPEELEELIRSRLDGDYLKGPQVSVTVTEYAARTVYVLGGVQRPGRYDAVASEQMSLLRLIALAGGLSDRAFKERVQILRKKPGGGREVLLVSLGEVERAVGRGAFDADLELFAGDLVIVGAGARSVYVLGAVAAPGAVELPPNARLTVSMVLSKVGSYTAFGAIDRIQVLRQSAGGSARPIVVNLDEVLAGDGGADVEVEPEDVIWVPERSVF